MVKVGHQKLPGSVVQVDCVNVLTTESKRTNQLYPRVYSNNEANS